MLLCRLLSLQAVEAHAINRYTSTSMTCSKIKATISREGAAIMQYRSPRGLPLYDRYVKNRQFSSGGQTTGRAYIPSCRSAGLSGEPLRGDRSSSTTAEATVWASGPSHRPWSAQK